MVNEIGPSPVVPLLNSPASVRGFLQLLQSGADHLTYGVEKTRILGCGRHHAGRHILHLAAAVHANPQVVGGLVDDERHAGRRGTDLAVADGLHGDGVLGVGGLGGPEGGGEREGQPGEVAGEGTWVHLDLLSLKWRGLTGPHAYAA